MTEAPTIFVAPGDRVRLGPVAEAVTGCTVKSIERRIERGIWLEGKEYHRGVDGSIMIDPAGVSAWVVSGRTVPPTSSRPDMGHTALYRHFDADGTLLYVGVSITPLRRLEAHREQSHWVRRIASVRVEWFSSRAAAMIAEAAVIKAERPLYNVVHACP